jgi:hypothetical protein
MLPSMMYQILRAGVWWAAYYLSKRCNANRQCGKSTGNVKRHHPVMSPTVPGYDVGGAVKHRWWCVQVFISFYFNGRPLPL